MPQISLYIDEETLRRIEKAAEAEKTSISKWVGTQLKKTLQTTYTEDFLNLFGSIKDEQFISPTREPFEKDTERESLP